MLLQSCTCTTVQCATVKHSTYLVSKKQFYNFNGPSTLHDTVQIHKYTSTPILCKVVHKKMVSCWMLEAAKENGA